jgi:hypothetical protein
MSAPAAETGAGPDRAQPVVKANATNAVNANRAVAREARRGPRPIRRRGCTPRSIPAPRDSTEPLDLRAIPGREHEGFAGRSRPPIRSLDAHCDSARPTLPKYLVPKSPKPPVDSASNDDENKRPTVVPPFDVEALARHSGTGEPSGRPPMRAQSVTLVDDVELEAARLASMHRSSLPPVLTSIPLREPERPGEDPVLEILSTPPIDGDPLDEARLRLDAGDEAGALAIVEDLLRRAPSHAPARELAAECERVLVEKYSAALGRLDRVPKLAVPLDRLVSLALDHRAGFLISFVDGLSTVAAIVDMSGMPPSEVLHTLLDLKEQGVISLR